MKLLLALTLGSVLHPAVSVRDIDGVAREPLHADKGHAQTLFFIAQDCPISNYYSHEIRRICEEYSGKGLGCTLVYIDPTLTDAQARKHADDYGHGSYPKIVDRKHELVEAAGATITPEAVVVQPDGLIAYRGRIDNFYAALGRPRRIVTEHDLRDALDEVFSRKAVAKPDVHPVGCYIPGLSAYSPGK